METPRFLPASRVQDGGQPRESLSLRTLDGYDVGVIRGFVIEPGSARIRSLVVDTGGGAQRELAISPLQYDPTARVLRIMSPTADVDLRGVDFTPDSIPEISDEDLWVPVFHSAA
jgi:hypothetical protein